MSKIMINIQVNAADRYAVRHLRREIERIAAYDGKTVTVTFNNELPSLISYLEPANPALASVLSAADAAVSPWYRATPVGKPFQARVDAAADTMREHLQKSSRAANREARIRVFTNRADYIATNMDAISAKFGMSRGMLEAQYQSLLAAQNSKGR